MSWGANASNVAKVLTIPALITVVILVEEVSFTYRKRNYQPSEHTHTTPPSSSHPAPRTARLARDGSNLVYWTPHKTGSTSMRSWIRKVAATVGANMTGKGVYYPYSDFLDHAERLSASQNGAGCAFVIGHIRVPPFSERHDERKLGAVITTTRRSFNTLASKFFHRTADRLTEKSLKDFKSSSSRASRRWFFYWHDSNACEPLQYYDGLDRCELNDAALTERARSIADRIDCTVDMDDPDPDVAVLCEQLRVSNNDCPRFPERNTKPGRSLYDSLYDFPHIKAIIADNVRVTDVLRDQLMMKRCRFFPNGNLTSGGYDAPRWPSLGCSS